LYNKTNKWKGTYYKLTTGFDRFCYHHYDSFTRVPRIQ